MEIILFFSSVDYSVKFKGSDAAERGSVFYALTSQDMPSAVLAKAPKKVSPGTAATVALSIRTVIVQSSHHN